MINHVHVHGVYIEVMTKVLLLEQVIDYSHPLLQHCQPSVLLLHVVDTAYSHLIPPFPGQMVEPDRQHNLAVRSDGYVGGAGIMALLHTTVIIAGNNQTKAWFLQYLKGMQL